MGLFSKKEDINGIQNGSIWTPLENLIQLDTLENDSFSKSVAIFKHSTRCGISRFVLKQFEKEYNIDANKIDLYYLDLLENRQVSNEVASRFGITHQSPQLIVIRNGKAVFHASHDSISAKELEKFTEN
ncbi:MAG: thioredoxin family protein [Flavobacterium sp. BFFFF1]|uniref:bacillithiol system redox-active protein YtxJ n=1 Tax=Flavobacterium sp. BFFFF1 TaxID=2015557 RepID=UPI000BD6E289|nr:bacillithiol system redox-active protein YtxJ [Flavobacterium sp. BFFFF1]OYU80381.1 MAG: thioredoxin family protein [Flavobacterium sp. BFFFF1]